MSESTNINLDTSKYRMPTQEDINNAKKFILRRNDHASILESRVDAILIEAAGEIAEICLKYNIPAKDFTMTANKQMFAEIEEVMDRIEEQIMSLIELFSTMVTDNQARKKLLALYIASLGRGNNNLQKTLDGYLYRYLYDLEAIIASMKLAKENGSKLTTAAIVSKVKSSQHTIYTTPEVKQAISAKNIAPMQAMYIRSHGRHIDNTGLSYVGSSNSNANNILRMARTTMDMAWMRNLSIDYQENAEIVGFFVSRGSSYDCKICDSQVGFHAKGDLEELPLYHPNCKCWVMPIYSNKDKYNI